MAEIGHKTLRDEDVVTLTLEESDSVEDVVKLINANNLTDSYRQEAMLRTYERLCEELKRDENTRLFNEKITEIFPKFKRGEINKHFDKLISLWSEEAKACYESYKKSMEELGESPYTEIAFQAVLPEEFNLFACGNDSNLKLKVLKDFCPIGQKEKVIERINAAFGSKVSLVVSREDIFDDEKRKRIEEILQKTEIKNLVVFTDVYERQSSDMERYIFTKEEFNQMIDIQREFKTPILIKEGKHFGDFFTLDQVRDANEKIDEVVDEIKENNFSPLEAMAHIHLYVTRTFSYNEGSDQMNIMGAYAKNEIVCAGFSSLTRAIVQRLGYDDLKCDNFSMTMIDKDTGGLDRHVRCLIKIKDEKYGVSGNYTNDACWDSDQKTFCEFLRPLSDMKCHKIHEFHPYTEKTDMSSFYPHTDTDLDDFINENDSGEPIEWKMIWSSLKTVLNATEDETTAKKESDLILNNSLWMNQYNYTEEARGPFSSMHAFVKSKNPNITYASPFEAEKSQKKETTRVL